MEKASKAGKKSRKGKKSTSAGRPPMDPEKGPAGARINLRITEDLEKKLKAMMKEEGIDSVSAYIRRVLEDAVELDLEKRSSKGQKGRSPKKKR